MKRLLFAIPLCALLLCGAAKVTRATVVAMELSLDRQLLALFPEDPIDPVGLTHGAYVSGYGVIFTGELNLAPSAGFSPFHQSVTKDEVTRLHTREIGRLPKLRIAMQHMLVSSAASLDAVPPEEQVALALTLFHFHWELLSGIPSQIVMHAPKKTLLAINASRPDPTAAIPGIAVEEF